MPIEKSDSAVDEQIVIGSRVAAAAVTTIPRPLLRGAGIRAQVSMGITVIYQQANQSEINLAAKQKLRSVLEQCCMEHPEIVTDPSIKSGRPIIGNSRVAVDYILDRLVLHESVRKVARLFAAEITEAQIREAVAFTRDFMEKVCDQFEVDD